RVVHELARLVDDLAVVVGRVRRRLSLAAARGGGRWRDGSGSVRGAANTRAHNSNSGGIACNWHRAELKLRRYARATAAPGATPTSGGAEAPPLLTLRSSGAEAPRLLALRSGGAEAPPLLALRSGGAEAPRLLTLRSGGAEAPPLLATGGGRFRTSRPGRRLRLPRSCSRRGI